MASFKATTDNTMFFYPLRPRTPNGYGSTCSLYSWPLFPPPVLPRHRRALTPCAWGHLAWASRGSPARFPPILDWRGVESAQTDRATILDLGFAFSPILPRGLKPFLLSTRWCLLFLSPLGHGGVFSWLLCELFFTLPCLFLSLRKFPSGCAQITLEISVCPPRWTILVVRRCIYSDFSFILPPHRKDPWFFFNRECRNLELQVVPLFSLSPACPWIPWRRRLRSTCS